jgi:hypothetical protein
MRADEDSVVLQLSASGSDVSLDAETLTTLQTEFRDRHCVRVKGLLAPDLLASLLPRLAHAQFEETEYHDIGRDLCMVDNVVLHALHFVVNDPAWLRLVERVTGCESLGCYLGRVYRMLPNSGHAEDWHDDMSGTRRIGMSVNLSSEVFEGGAFQLRHYGDDAPRLEVQNTGLGDAILFPIANTLQHRVMPVTGTFPKTALAGWFRSEPSYWDPTLEP